MAITATDFQNIELAIAAYTDEMYTVEKKLHTSALVADDPTISGNGESYIGQLRFHNTISPTFNTPSLTSATDGSFSDISTYLATYIKGAGDIGFNQVNLQNMISQQNGFDKVARDMAEMKAQHRDLAVKNVLRGVAAAEAAVGTEGIEFFGDVDTAGKGFYVDINALGEFGAAATGSGDARTLIDTSVTGASAGSRLFRAVGMARS